MRQVFCITVLLILVISCGKQDFPNYQPSEEEFQLVTQDETHKGTLLSLNKQRFSGKYLVRVLGDKLYIEIKVKNAPKDTRIQQVVHSGSKCPGPYSDLDRDGFVTYDEILISSGDPLFYLKKGEAKFPISDEWGEYSYTNQSSLRKLRQKLLSERLIGQDEYLNLGRRTVVFYGSPQGPLHPIGCIEL